MSVTWVHEEGPSLRIWGTSFKTAAAQKGRVSRNYQWKPRKEHPGCFNCLEIKRKQAKWWWRIDSGSWSTWSWYWGILGWGLINERGTKRQIPEARTWQVLRRCLSIPAIAFSSSLPCLYWGGALHSRGELWYTLLPHLPLLLLSPSPIMYEADWIMNVVPCHVCC